MGAISIQIKCKATKLDEITTSIRIDRVEVQGMSLTHSGTERNQGLLTCPLIRDKFSQNFPIHCVPGTALKSITVRSLSMQPQLSLTSLQFPTLNVLLCNWYTS